MQTINTIHAIRSQLENSRKEGKSIAFVPTMGNLHSGHLQLIEQAKLKADIVVASIFVNPLQFGPKEDYQRYPRTPQEDALILAEAGVDFLFLPTMEEMYPQVSQHTTVHVPGLSEILCGKFRPTHFDGVATVVTKLLNIIHPNLLVLGKKDFQQVHVIQKLVLELSLAVEIEAVPTVREQDGLAISSRNQYLSAEGRRLAPELYRILLSLVEQIKMNPHMDPKDIEKVKIGYQEALITLGFKVDYLEVRDASTLYAINPSSEYIVVLVAATLGNTRLIDNIDFKRH